MPRRLGVDKYGKPSWCYAQPGNEGKWSCPHIFHQENGESDIDFLKRAENLQAKNERQNNSVDGEKLKAIANSISKNNAEHKALSIHAENAKRTVNNKRFSFHSSFGDAFEDEMFDRFQVVYRKKDKGIIKKSTSEQDALEGTDMFIYEVPVDLTLNNAKGGAIQWSDQTVTAAGIDVKFGIRTGNGVKNFEKPVVVMYFPVTLCRNGISDFAHDRLKEDEIIDLAEKAIDLYYEYEDSKGN